MIYTEFAKCWLGKLPVLIKDARDERSLQTQVILRLACCGSLRYMMSLTEGLFLCHVIIPRCGRAWYHD